MFLNFECDYNNIVEGVLFELRRRFKVSRADALVPQSTGFELLYYLI